MALLDVPALAAEPDALFGVAAFGTAFDTGGPGTVAPGALLAPAG